MADRKTHEPPKERGNEPRDVENKMTKMRYTTPEAEQSATEVGYTAEVAKKVLEQEAKTRHSSVEVATIMDKDGNVRFTKKGSESQVKFGYVEILKMRDGILTHNHPNAGATNKWWKAIGSPFSEADIKTAVRANLAEIRAVTPTYTFSLKRPEGGWPEGMLKRYSSILGKYTRAQNKYAGGKDVVDYMLKGGEDVKTYYQRANRARLAKYHQVLKDLAKEYGLSYTRKKNEK